MISCYQHNETDNFNKLSGEDLRDEGSKCCVCVCVCAIPLLQQHGYTIRSTENSQLSTVYIAKRWTLAQSYTSGMPTIAVTTPECHTKHRARAAKSCRPSSI